MSGWSTISLFVAAASVLVVIPGPNTLYIIARSVQQGVKGGVVSCLGIMVATLCHVTAAALGLSALVLSSALAFNVVKFAGAAYLIYLGIRALLTSDQAPAVGAAVRECRLREVFFQGVVVNLFNPKTALFIAAFLPQFIEVDARIPVAGQICFFGVLLVIIGGISDLAYALLAGRIGRALQINGPLRTGSRYLAGLTYIGLGAATSFTGAKHG